MAGSLCVIWWYYLDRGRIGRLKVCLLASTWHRIDSGENSNSRKLFVLALQESREEKVNWKKSAKKKYAGSPHSEGKKLDEKNREIEMIFGLQNKLSLSASPSSQQSQILWGRRCSWSPERRRGWGRPSPPRDLSSLPCVGVRKINLAAEILFLGVVTSPGRREWCLSAEDGREASSEPSSGAHECNGRDLCTCQTSRNLDTKQSRSSVYQAFHWPMKSGTTTLYPAATRGGTIFL